MENNRRGYTFKTLLQLFQVNLFVQNSTRNLGSLFIRRMKILIFGTLESVAINTSVANGYRHPTEPSCCIRGSKQRNPCRSQKAFISHCNKCCMVQLRVACWMFERELCDIYLSHRCFETKGLLRWLTSVRL